MYAIEVERCDRFVGLPYAHPGTGHQRMYGMGMGVRFFVHLIFFLSLLVLFCFYLDVILGLL